MDDPLVLVHGILGFGQLTLGGINIVSYFRHIPEALRERGYIVPNPPQLNPTTSIEMRANELKEYLDAREFRNQYGDRVHIVAHSMGGLDARYMISLLGMADRVLSLTTIGTPHHGSPVADKLVGNADPIVIALFDKLGVKGVYDLTTKACSELNDQCEEQPGINYFSIAGRFEPDRILGLPQGLLGLTHDYIQMTDGENDGLVSVDSARFGSDEKRWEFVEYWDANHFRLINWGTNITLQPSELEDMTIVENYLNIVGRVVQKR